MSIELILKDLKNKIYKPIYFLYGEEPYYIDLITKYIETNALKPEEQGFNQTVLYGKDTDINSVIELSRRFPMMSNYQVVIIKEAQDIRNMEELVHYAKSPLNSTILVINYKYKKLDARKKGTKELKALISKSGIFFESKKLYPNQINEWIDRYIAKKGYKIHPKATTLLSEYLGDDLSKIANEIEKLFIVCDKNGTITPADIEHNIGISKDFNNYELQDALGTMDVLKANKIIDYYIKNPKQHPAILTITSLYFFYTKLLIFHKMEQKSDNNLVGRTLGINPFFVKDYKIAARNYSYKKLENIISYLREYNLKIIGIGNVSTQPEELLRELIFKILH